jgi:hypothetical protein
MKSLLDIVYISAQFVDKYSNCTLISNTLDTLHKLISGLDVENNARMIGRVIDVTLTATETFANM